MGLRREMDHLTIYRGKNGLLGESGIFMLTLAVPRARPSRCRTA